MQYHQYQYHHHHQTSIVQIMDQKGWLQGSSAEMMISPNCPRCGSSNTKFCYYNNYSLTQPRYFCKGCRRYWTKGGNLRNVPVGGGCRKNRRPTKSSSLRLHSSTTHLLSNNRAASHPDLLASSSDSPTASHIDLAVVYANFLNNPQPPKSTHNVISKAGSDDSNIIVGVLEEDDSSIIPSSSNNIHQMALHNQEQSGSNTNNSIGFFGWDSLSDLFADTSDHLKVTDESISGQIYDMHHHPAIQQCSRANNVNTGSYFELPPLPGEEGVIGGCREITMETAAATWSESGQHHHQLLLDHHDDHSLAATELLPIMINGPPDNNEAPAPAPAPAAVEDSHQLNLIGTNNNSKDFDFGDHDTFLSN